MKKSNWLALGLIGLSVAALIGYTVWDRMATDTTAPELSVEDGILQISVHEERDMLLQGISARDDRDGDVTASVIVENVGSITGDGQATVQYAAFDHAGNVAKISRTIQYTDYEPPKFVLKAPLVFTAGSSFEVVDLMGAVDALDGDISYRVRAMSLAEGALSEAGNYEVEFRVSNTMGDTRKLTLTVVLEPAGSYNAELTLTDYLVYLPRGSRFQAGDYLDVFRYSGNRVNLAAGIPDGYQLNLAGSVDTKTPGVYEVQYTLNYAQGYQTYTGSSRLVVIVEE